MSLVANNIKYLRRMNGLTQEQFARRIGIKRSLLGAYEEGRANPNLDNLMNIAKIFGTTVDNLLKNDIRRLREVRGCHFPNPRRNWQPSLNPRRQNRWLQSLTNTTASPWRNSLPNLLPSRWLNPQGTLPKDQTSPASSAIQWQK
jgi:transcriptional regulator with XRE-family HTH domain